MADDMRARISQPRDRGRALRAEFAFVEGEYTAGRITLLEEAALLAAITHEMNDVVTQLLALTAYR